ncbi:hypothetical protein ENSA5_18700 [Enhygromyxa salina]|uniref:Lipoprotein n=1 Tax=Enhygromyxa salina TaxID=215803 RepID=A0A2S9YD45_9BACT|nr:hypothetical protein [Enhygromyxa salina]PRQ02931.1 hypothetical protein ENSA5_18700 [Enhygromyxa salina]
MRVSTFTLAAAASLVVSTGCTSPAPETTPPEQPVEAEAASPASDTPEQGQVSPEPEAPEPETSPELEPSPEPETSPYEVVFAGPVSVGGWRCRTADDSVALSGWSYAGGPVPGPKMVVRRWTLWIDREPVASRHETMDGTTTGAPLRRRSVSSPNQSGPVAPTDPWTEKVIIDREDGEPLIGNTRQLRVTLDCERSSSPPMP